MTNEHWAASILALEACTKDSSCPVAPQSCPSRSMLFQGSLSLHQHSVPRHHGELGLEILGLTYLYLSFFKKSIPPYLLESRRQLRVAEKNSMFSKEMGGRRTSCSHSVWGFPQSSCQRYLEHRTLFLPLSLSAADSDTHPMALGSVVCNTHEWLRGSKSLSEDVNRRAPFHDLLFPQWWLNVTH